MQEEDIQREMTRARTIPAAIRARILRAVMEDFAAFCGRVSSAGRVSGCMISTSSFRIRGNSRVFLRDAIYFMHMYPCIYQRILLNICLTTGAYSLYIQFLLYDESLGIPA